MRVKPFIMLAIAALLLAGVVILASLNRNPFGKTNTGFAIPRDRQVNSIIIGNDEEVFLTLSLRDDTWIVNGEGEARESAINFILTTIHTMEIKSPLPEATFDGMVNLPGVSPLRVTIKTAGARDRHFYIYPATDSFPDAVFRLSLRSKPYTMSVPGYPGDPGTFFVTDERFWLPYRIFSLKPGSITEIRVSYRDPEMEGFTIISEEEGYTVKGRDGREIVVDQEKVSRYLSWFGFVPFESWAFELPPATLDELSARDPEITLSLVTTGGESAGVSLWSRSIESADGNTPDTDRLYGSPDSGKHFFIVKYFDIDPLLKTADYFIKR